MSICQHIIEIMVLFSEGLSNPVHDEVYSIQHYVLKFVSDLQQVGCFLRGTQDSSTILLKVALNTINQPYHIFRLYIILQTDVRISNNSHFIILQFIIEKLKKYLFFRIRPICTNIVFHPYRVSSDPQHFLIKTVYKTLLGEQFLDSYEDICHYWVKFFYLFIHSRNFFKMA